MIVYILFPSCSLPRLDTPVNFTRKHRRAFQCAELSVVSENNRALTQSVPPKKVYIEYIYIYKGFFFGGGLFVLFFVLGGFLLRLCQNPVAFSKFNVRSCTNVLSFEHDDIQIEFFYKTNFTLYKDIALFHSSLTLFFCFETKCRIFTNVFCTYVIIYITFIYIEYISIVFWSMHCLQASTK